MTVKPKIISFTAGEIDESWGRGRGSLRSF